MQVRSSYGAAPCAPALELVNGGGAGARLSATRAGAPSNGMAATLDDILSAAVDLAAQPQTMARLLEITGDPGATVEQLEGVILSDQTLAARVLALANSAYFALPRKVLYAREAVVFLGFKMVRNLALAVHTQQLFRDAPRQLARIREGLWRHSLDVAFTSRAVAEILHNSRRADIGSEEAFTAGLLHDIGKLVQEAWDSDRAMLASRLMQERGLRYIAVEGMLFPHNHCVVGAQLAVRWALPPALGESMAYHHSPESAVSAPQIAAIVALANEIAHLPAEIGDPLSPAMESACGLLGLDSAELPKLIEACRAEIECGQALHALL